MVEPGEGSKSLAVFGRVCEEALAAKIERRDVVIALGGGVVGDLAGFVSASLRRGAASCRYRRRCWRRSTARSAARPAINSPQGKNLIGAFHQPSLVLADVDTLADAAASASFAPATPRSSNMALIGDRRFFDWLEADGDAVFSRQAGADLRHRGELRDEGLHRRTRRDRAGRPRAAQSRPYLRPRAWSGSCGYDSAPSRAWRRRGDRPRAGATASRTGSACATGRTRCASSAIWSGSDCRRASATFPASSADAEAILEAMYQDKKVERGALTFVLAARDRRRLRRQDTSTRERSCAFLKSELCKGIASAAGPTFLEAELTTVDIWIGAARRSRLRAAVGVLLGLRDGADGAPRARICIRSRRRATGAPRSSRSCCASATA